MVGFVGGVMPGAVPVHEGLFEAAADGAPRLLGGRCGACGKHHFPRAGTCPWCSAADVGDAFLSRTGTLWGWTSVAAPPPGYEGEVPFGFGVVELPEGLRVVSRLTEADPHALTYGQPMRLVTVPIGDDDGTPVVTWAFAPDADVEPGDGSDGGSGS